MTTNRSFILKAVLSCQDQLSEKLKGVRKNLRTLDRAFKNVTTSAGDVASKVFAPLAAIGGSGLLSVGASVSTFMELGDSIDKAAIRAGAATGALQKLRFAAQLSGMDAEEMDRALSRLTAEMGKAASGDNKKLVTLFDQLGVSWKDSSGHARDSATVMRELADAVKANEDPATQLQILTDVFGEKLAARLLPTLKDGAAGLDSMAAQAEKLGIVMSGDDIAKAAELGDTLDIFHQVVRGLAMTIGARLAPIIQRIVLQIQDVIAANRELIAQRISEICEALAKAIEGVDFGAIISGFIETAKVAFDVFQWLGGVRTILLLVAGVMAGKALTSVTSLASSLFGLGKAVWAAAGPFGIAAGLIAAAALYVATHWEQVKAKLQETWAAITTAFSEFVDPKIAALQNFAANVKAAFIDALAPVKAAWDSVKAAISPIFNWFDEKLKGLVGLMPDWLKDLIGGGSTAPAQLAAPSAAGGYGVLPATGAGVNGQAYINIAVEAKNGARANIEGMNARNANVDAETRGGYDPGDSF